MDVTMLNIGETATVVSIAGGRGLITKLAVLGIRPGVRLTKVSAQMFRGPVNVRVGNTEVGLGYGMASRILVEKEG